MGERAAVSDDWEDLPAYELPAPKPGQLTMPDILAEANRASRAGVPRADVEHWIKIHTGDASPDSLSDDWEPLGPGIGRPAPPNLQREAADLARREHREPATEILSGVIRGAYGTAVGASQFAAHLTPGAVAYDAVASRMGRPTVAGQTDEWARQHAADTAADPNAQTLPGKTGQFIGGMLATAPLTALSVPAKGASFLSAVGRGVAGGAATAATQPTTGDFASEKFNQAALGGVVGGAVPLVGRAALATAEHLYGPNALSQVAYLPQSAANRSGFAQEGEDLAARTGVRLTPGQVSGSKVQTSLENMARQSVFSADRAFEADTKIANDAVRYVDRLMDGITRNPGSEATVGTQIQAVTRAAVDKIAKQRETVAARQYGAIDMALKGRPFVQPTNAIKEANAIIAEYGNIPTPEAERIVQQAKALRDKLHKTPPGVAQPIPNAYTFSDAQKMRGYYGRGARGGANVFDDVNPDINRQIATRLFRAFDADMDQSAQRLGGGNVPGLVPPGHPGGIPGLSDAIRQANANYRKYSQLIEATKSHPIARLFGDNINIDDVLVFDKIPPETVIQRLGQMHPSEIQQVRGYMETQAPETWQQYKRLLIERALESARTLPTSSGANTVEFNAALFMRSLGGDKPDKVKKLQALFTADEFNQIDDAIKIARRLGDRTGYNGSGTGPYNEAVKLFESLKQRSAQAIASSVGEGMGLHRVANVMLNADGRRAVMTLARLPPRSQQAASLLGYLSALAAGQQVSYPSNEQRSR